MSLDESTSSRSGKHPCHLMKLFKFYVFGLMGDFYLVFVLVLWYRRASGTKRSKSNLKRDAYILNTLDHCYGKYISDPAKPATNFWS